MPDPLVFALQAAVAAVRAAVAQYNGRKGGSSAVQVAIGEAAKVAILMPHQ